MIEARYTNPLALAEISFDDAIAGKEGVYLPLGRALRSVSRRPATFIDDPDQTKMISDQYKLPHTLAYPPLFLSSWCDCRVFGFRTIVSNDGRWSSDTGFASDQDEQAHMARKKISFGEDTTASWNEESKTFSFSDTGRPVVHLEGTTILLTSNEPSNYGSFIFRVLPKLTLVKDIGKQVRFLVYARHESFRELLRLAGIPDDQILYQETWKIYHCDHLICVSNRNLGGLLDQHTLDFFNDMRQNNRASEQQEESPAHSELMYISRYNPDGAVKRRMLNEGELIDELLKEGFRIFDPSSVSVKEQINAFLHAKLVVGPSGAGMFNAVFCEPNTKLIDIESEPHWIYAHSGLFGSLQLDFGIFVGNPTDRDWKIHHKDWTINIPALLSRIRAFK